ncbi:hypothetical protein HanRHA438_Chr01g0031521 [Helianthus annuus]|nr:hypothetical protein HanRHA438_Chr01g0031521 [Helianthus annuus]
MLCYQINIRKFCLCISNLSRLEQNHTPITGFDPNHEPTIGIRAMVPDLVNLTIC